MKVNIYVDGFNLYYGAVKGTPYRWLNIAAMCRLLLPRNNIHLGLLNPHKKHPSVALSPHVRFVKQIRAGVLAKSQFPRTLTDRNGSFSKPASW